MTHREKLEKAIFHLESQRHVLGNETVDAACMLLRAELDTSYATTVRLQVAARHAAERKLVTVMFADISGFTALSETMDPESIRDIMNNCFERLTPVIEKYDRTVDKFIGDAIMALFGAPVTHENDPERALSAALEMSAELQSFNRERGLALGLHFGINTGLVIAGGIGTDTRMDYSVMGDTVNVAARLEDASEKGEILVGPDTYRLTASQFEFEVLDPIKVKGKSQPVRAYRLLGRLSRARLPREEKRHRISSPMVGRDEEVGVVQRCVHDTLDGHGRILAIMGDAGMGKTRLIEEIRDRYQSSADNLNLMWLEGHTVSFGRAISFLPFREILSQCAGITEEDGEEASWGKLEFLIFSLFRAETPEVLPYLATLASLDVKARYAGRVKYLDSEAMRRQVFIACRAFFERLARAQPVVMVLEDLHWADSSSRLLLDYLLPLVEHVSLLICCTSRPDAQTDKWFSGALAAGTHASHYREVRLAPLTERHSNQLVRNLLEKGDIPRQLRHSMLSRAGGNPYFIEEIIESLIDRGVATRDPATGRWLVTSDSESARIPGSIQGVIMGRMDLLDEDVKRVLRAAAVIGRSFLYRVLQAICDPGVRLDACLLELQAIEIIQQKQPGREPAYIFKNALAQEVMYESILLRDRKGLHARVGHAIEEIFSDLPDEFSSLLAYHYAQAEEWEKAQEFLFKAGDQAERIAADEEALLWYQQALAAQEGIIDTQWDVVDRAALARKMGGALFRRGEYSQAMDFVQQGLQALGNPLPTSPTGIRAQIVLEASTQLLHRLWAARREADADLEADAALEEELHLYEVAGWIDAFGNYERLLLLTLRMLNRSERRGFAYGISKGSMALGTICDLFALFGAADSYHSRALTIGERIGHQGAVGLAQTGRAFHANCKGDWSQAVEWATHSAKVFQDTGDLHARGFAVYMKAVAFAYAGKLHQALTDAEALVKLGSEGSDPQVCCWGFSTRGVVLRMAGRLDEALEALDAAVEPANEAHDYAVQMWIGSESGRCLMVQGRLEEALTALEESWRLHRVHKSLSLIWVSLHNAVAEVRLAAAEQSGEPPARERMRAARAACKAALKNARSFRGLMPEAMRLYAVYQWLRNKPDAARAWWGRSIGLARVIGQDYDLAVALREMGARTRDEKAQEQGSAILARIGIRGKGSP